MEGISGQTKKDECELHSSFFMDTKHSGKTKTIEAYGCFALYNSGYKYYFAALSFAESLEIFLEAAFL